MKKILLIASIILLMFAFIGCEEPKPDCEENNTCTVNVANHTGYMIYVDVTWGSYDYNDERYINNGYYTSYKNVPAGSLTVWASFDGNSWTYDDIYVGSCDEFKYTWYYNKKSPPLQMESVEVPSFDPSNHPDGTYELVITKSKKH